MTPGPTIIRSAGVAMVFAGALLLSYAGVVLIGARIADAAFRSTLEASVSAKPSGARVAPPAPLTAGEAIGELRIDRLKLSAVIGQGESDAVLRRGVGHLADTAWLGQRGNVVLAGHRDTIFRALREIQPGDLIDVTTPDRQAQYEVQSLAVVPPTALDVLKSADDNTLTLITCYPFSFIGPAPDRFIVRAREIR